MRSRAKKAAQPGGDPAPPSHGSQSSPAFVAAPLRRASLRTPLPRRAKAGRGDWIRTSDLLNPIGVSSALPKGLNRRFRPPGYHFSPWKTRSHSILSGRIQSLDRLAFAPDRSERDPAGDREARVQAHLERIRSDPRWRGRDEPLTRGRLRGERLTGVLPRPARKRRGKRRSRRPAVPPGVPAWYTIAEARPKLSRLLDRVAAGERIGLSRWGRPAAVLVSPPDAERPASGVI
ncbi:MAG: type II toxin-antitoxin system prevent-host-death family antitoxin [Planctomycetes bacterium]|nr:type II toxin-antitoxin system prevent-host-death family antitoxin [Planctomycetota bacterium]